MVAEQAATHTHAEWHQLTQADAVYLGRLSGAGLVLPNHSRLNEIAQPIETLSDAVIQAEVARLADAVANVSTIRGVAGMAHSQLTPSEDAPDPLQIIMVGGRSFLDAPIIRIRGRPFQCLLNATVDLGMNHRKQRGAFEPCFSNGLVTSHIVRPPIRLLQAMNVAGEIVVGQDITGFRARVLQHEIDHAIGKRAGDYTPRTWQHRGVRSLFQGKECGYSQWRALATDPAYPFFPTEELKEAFLAGREKQLKRNR